MVAPERNLPPDAQAWGRDVEKKIADIQKRLGIVTTNIKATSARVTGVASAARGAQDDIDSVVNEGTETGKDIAQRPKSSWDTVRPTTPEHNERWLDVADGNVLNIYVDYGTEERTNHVLNPTFRIDTYGWESPDATLTTTPDDKALVTVGVDQTAATLQEITGRPLTVTLPGQPDDEDGGGYDEVTLGAPVTASAEVTFLSALPGATARIEAFYPDGTVLASSGNVAMTSGAPLRIVARTLPEVATSTEPVRVVIYLDAPNDPGFEATVDDVILEGIDYGADGEQMYFDGSMPGVLWEGLDSRATSWWDGLPRWVEVQDIKLKNEVFDELEVLEGELADLNDRLEDLDLTDLPALRDELDNLIDTILPGLADRLADAEGILGPLPGAVSAAEAAAEAAQTAASNAEAAASAAQTTAADAEQAALDAAGVAEGKGQVITQVSAPTGPQARAENLWVRLPDHKVHIYDGNDWVPATDPDLISAASDAAQAIQDAADATQAAQDAADAAQDAHDRAEALEGQVGTLQTDLAAAEAALATVQNTTLPALNADLATLRDTTIPNLEAIVGPLPGQVQAAATAASNAATAASNAQADATQALSDAESKAAAAQAAAQDHADAQAEAARLAAIAAASDDAEAKANAAQAAAEATAAADALDKANAAQQAAEAVANAAQQAADDAQADADALAGRADALEGTVGTLTADLDTLRDTTIPNLEAIVGPLPAAVTAAQAAADAAQAEAETKATMEWVLSRGTDLVTNGTGYMGDNTNFSPWVFDPSDAPAGANGSFLKESNSRPSAALSDEYIPVDPSKTYLMSVKAKDDGAPGSRLYMGIAAYDAAGGSITPYTYSHYATSTTHLTQPLNPGDTQVHVEQIGSAWAASGATNYIGLWDWTDTFGKVWPEGTYTRDYLTSTAHSGNTFTIAAYNGQPRPVGTPVSRMVAGGTYMYIAGSPLLTEDWVTYSGKASGLHDGSTGRAATTSFPPGTAMIRLLFLPNYNSHTGSRQRVAGVSFSDATAALAEAEAAQARADAAHVRAAALEGQVGTLQTDLSAAATSLATVRDTTLPALNTRLESTEYDLDNFSAEWITAGTLDADRLNFNEIAGGVATIITLHGDRIVANSIGAGQIAAESVAGAVGSFLELNANQITAGLIQGDQIEAQSIYAAVANLIRINASQINAGEIGADRIAVNDLAAEMATVITLNADRITSGEIGAARINTTELAVSLATILELDAGTITSGTIDTDRLSATEIAGAVGTFLDLRADQITAVGGGFDTLVANQMFADIFTTNKITAGEADLDSFVANTGFVADLSANILTADAIKATHIDMDSLTGDSAFIQNVTAEVITADNFEGQSFTGVDFIGSTFRGSSFSTDASLSGGIYIGPDISADHVVNGMIKFGDPASIYAPEITYHYLGSGASRRGNLIIKGPGDDTAIGGTIAFDPFGVIRIEGRAGHDDDVGTLITSSRGPTEVSGRAAAGRSDIHFRGTVRFADRFTDAYVPDAQIFRIEPGSGSDTHLRNGASAIQVWAGAGLRLADHNTHSNAANVYMSYSTGEIRRSTSLRAAKVGIEEVETDVAKRLLAVRPTTFYDRGDVEQYAEHLHQIEKSGESDVRVDDVEPFRRIGGLVAEEVLEAGLEDYVQYDEEGEPVGIAYDRLWTLLIPLVREQQQRIVDLEARLN